MLHRGSNCSVSVALNGRITCRGIVADMPISAATCEIVKRFYEPTRVRSALESTRLLYLYIRRKIDFRSSAICYHTAAGMHTTHPRINGEIIEDRLVLGSQISGRSTFALLIGLALYYGGWCLSCCYTSDRHIVRLRI